MRDLAIDLHNAGMVIDIDWPLPDDLARALVGLPNGGDYTGAEMREAA